MKIRILLFAILRDAAGTGEVAIECHSGAKVDEVRSILGQQYPALVPYLPRVAFAVNRSYVPSDCELHEEDEVALIPPVSGG